MKVRVLALCGFTQNAFIYSKQLGAIRRTCKDVEFVVLEPPIVVEKADMPWNSNTSDFDSEASTETEQQTAETTPRAWYLSTGDRKVYKGYEDTLKYIYDFMLKNGPFDGVMGFSQGGCVAATLAALCEKPGVNPLWPADPSIPKLKFLIAVGGFYPASTTPSFVDVFPLPASLPTLHVMGRGDVVVPPERSMTLVQQCQNARVEYHEGGHFTPSKASWRHFFNAYISSFAEGGSQGENIPAIASFGPSGTSTPVTPRSSSPLGTRPRIRPGF